MTGTYRVGCSEVQWKGSDGPFLVLRTKVFDGKIFPDMCLTSYLSAAVSSILFNMCMRPRKPEYNSYTFKANHSSVIDFNVFKIIYW